MKSDKEGPVIPEELAEFLQSGLSLQFGTRDGALAPHGARASAVVVDEDRMHVTAYLTAKTAAPLLRNLEDNGRAAISCDRPSTNRACQIKGTFVETRPCREDERAEIERQVDAFFSDLEYIGFPRALFAGWLRWPAVAVRLRVTDLFQQTPGPGTGGRL